MGNFCRAEALNYNLRPLQNALFCPISVSGLNFNPQNTQGIPVVKIFALTRGVHALALTGSMTAVQFRDPAELPLNVNKNEHFSKVSILS